MKKLNLMVAAMMVAASLTACTEPSISGTSTISNASEATAEAVEEVEAIENEAEDIESAEEVEVEAISEINEAEAVNIEDLTIEERVQLVLDYDEAERRSNAIDFYIRNSDLPADYFYDILSDRELFPSMTDAWMEEFIEIQVNRYPRENEVDYEGYFSTPEERILSMEEVEIPAEAYGNYGRTYFEEK